MARLTEDQLLAKIVPRSALREADEHDYYRTKFWDNADILADYLDLKRITVEMKACSCGCVEKPTNFYPLKQFNMPIDWLLEVLIDRELLKKLSD